MRKSLIAMIVLPLLRLSSAHAADATAPATTWAVLQNGKEQTSTPKADHATTSETIRRSTVTLDGQTCTLALKSSISRRDGGYAYSVALSLSDSRQDDCTVSESGTMKTLQPLKFTLTRGNRQYPVTVYFRPTDTLSPLPE